MLTNTGNMNTYAYPLLLDILLLSDNRIIELFPGLYQTTTTGATSQKKKYKRTNNDLKTCIEN
jgi:hypothetical protein